MAKVLLNESSIGNNYAQRLAEQSIRWTPSDTDLIYKTLFRATSEYLGIIKSKERPVALVIEDLKGNLKMAGVVTYHKNEDQEDMPGNWSYEFILDKEEFEEREITSVVKYVDSSFQRVLSDVARTNGFEFKKVELACTLVEEAITVLLNWLDVNCKESGEVETVELEGYFEASVALENGEKVKSIVPDGEMKTLVKGDGTIEK